jgi:hypothetical protein
MRRPTLNLCIDALAFAAFVFLTTTGVLLRYVLPPGSGHFTSLWGWDRHAWGTLHFWIAVGFLSLLGVHLILHGRWIASMVRGRPREGSAARLALGVVGVIALVALALAPLFSPIEQTPRPRSGHLSAPAQHGPP